MNRYFTTPRRPNETTPLNPPT